MSIQYIIQEDDFEQVLQVVDLLDTLASMAGFTPPKTALQINVDSLTGTLSLMQDKLKHVINMAEYTNQPINL